MKDILIISFDMSIGGVERSLVNMLDSFDYETYKVDLKLYRNEGDLFELLNSNVNILDETKECKTFGTSLLQIIKEKEYGLAMARIVAKISAISIGKLKNIKEIGYYQGQLANHLSTKYIPNIDKEYDVAISYVWTHEIVAYKVKAKKKIAWIHTDYSTIYINRKMDLEVWDKFDHIVSVSEECKASFIKMYPKLKEKVIVVENIRSPKYVNDMANEEVDYMLDENNIKLLTVARLCHPKAIDNAIKAMNVLKNNRIDNVKWYVIGYGPDEDMLKNLIKENKLEDTFILLGKKINPYPYMKKCDIYVQPSRYEGKAVTVLEAQMLGKPVLITNYPTAKSQLKHNLDGYITDLSIDGIVNGVETLINNTQLRKKLEKNTKENDYSNLEELEKLYKVIEI